MGLDTSHDAWSGAYSSFMRWREKVAEIAGLPPLVLMEGFYTPLDNRKFFMPPTLHPGTVGEVTESLKKVDSLLPIKWSSLKPSPLHELLYHSDCDGYINYGACAKIAKELEKLLPLFPDESGDGHIGNWKQKTQQFIDGLKLAHKSKERLEFH